MDRPSHSDDRERVTGRGTSPEPVADERCTLSAGSKRRARPVRWFYRFWPFFVIPIVLTGLFVGGSGAITPRTVLLTLFVNTVISLGIGGMMYLLYDLVWPRIEPRIPRRVPRLFLHAVILLIGVPIGVEVAVRIISLFSWAPPIGDFRFDVLRGGFVVATVIVAIIVIYERLQAKARSAELREERARREALTAQLQALQARTNPHFLYNSLNTVAGLVEENPQRAEEVLERLSDLFRYALEGSRKERVRLAEELRAVSDYLAVEAIRFEERLRYRVEAEEGVESIAVPPLVLQPLVENAVLHGVAQQARGGTVRVAAARRNGSLVLTVEDDGPGPGRSSHRGTGSSIRDLNERLRLLYGPTAGVETEERAEGGCRVRARLPLPGPGELRP